MAAMAETAKGASLDIRVEDFLDDKLQSTTDLKDLDSLLANVELQRNQLQTQLDTAVKELEEARRTADDRQGSLLARIDEFQELQKSIDVLKNLTTTNIEKSVKFLDKKRLFNFLIGC